MVVPVPEPCIPRESRVEASVFLHSFTLGVITPAIGHQLRMSWSPSQGIDTHTVSGCWALVPEECIGTGIFLRHLWSATWHSMREVGKFIRTCFATTSSLDVPWVTEVTWQPRGQGLNTKGGSGTLWILSQFGAGAWVFI